MKISETKVLRHNRLDNLALSINICIVAISLTLTVFMRLHYRVTTWLKDTELFSKLPEAEIADRMTVIILLAFCAIGFFVLPWLVSKFKTESSVNWISIVALSLTILTISWRWGDPTFDTYRDVFWYGWGDKFALMLLPLGIITTYVVSLHLTKARSVDRMNISRAVNIGAAVILFCFYLPSIFQPFNGIIDIYHSRYILNDLLITASGRLPYSEITPQYVGILGWPLKLLSTFNSDVVVNSAVVWINVLVLVEIALIAYITKHALHVKSWAVAILIPVATMFVKVQSDESSWQNLDKEWKSWGSLAQHMNLIPGRTVLPIVLLFLVSALATDLPRRKKQIFTFATGIFLVWTTLNNIEFGAPAAIAVLIILGFLTRLSVVKPKDLIAVFLGSTLSVVLVAGLYRMNDSQLTLNNWLTMIRAHGVDGFMNLEMPFFGLWIFFYALLGTSAIIGSNLLFRTYKNSVPNSAEMRSAVLLTFSGLWGSATLFYFSGRSLVPEIIVFVIPLTLCIIGLIGVVRSTLENSEDNNIEKSEDKKFKIVLAPLFCIMLIPVLSLTQAPNPGFEWLRAAGNGERWSSRALKSLPKYQEMVEIVDENSSNKYLYMGNDGPAFEIMSGVENGLGIVLLQDLLISEELTRVGCLPALNSGADFALVPKGDWVNPPSRIPCPGFVLLPPDIDSEFLIYEIPSKVSS
jgi:hypothetical protein